MCQHLVPVMGQTRLTIDDGENVSRSRPAGKQWLCR
jgi:hypothetical protein